MNKIELRVSLRTFPNDLNESNLCESPLNGTEGVTFDLNRIPMLLVLEKGKGLSTKVLLRETGMSN